MKLINIGFGNMVSAERLVAVVSPDSAPIKRIVKGFMIESFLEEGNQKHDIVFGKSITDPCLGWEKTERLIYELAELR